MNMFATFSRLYADWTSTRSLSGLDNCRLSDLGLTRYDLFDARHLRGASRSELFASRRGERADAWLR